MKLKSIQEFRRGFLNSDSLPSTAFTLLDKNQQPILQDGRPLTVSIARNGETIVFNVGGVKTPYASLITTLGEIAPNASFVAKQSQENKIALEQKCEGMSLEDILSQLESKDLSNGLVIQLSSPEQGSEIREALFDLSIFPAGTEKSLIIDSPKDLAKLQRAAKSVKQPVLKKDAVPEEKDIPKADVSLEKSLERDVSTIKLQQKDRDWLESSQARAALRQVLKNPYASFTTLADVAGPLKGTLATAQGDGAFYNTFYRFVERKFGSFYEGGREKFLEYLEYVGEDTKRLYPKVKEKEPLPPPKYSSLPFLADEFLKRTERPDRLERSEDYEGNEGGMRFLRYYSLYRRKLESDSKVDARRYGPGGGISPQIVQRRLPDSLYGRITPPHLRLEDSKKIRREMSEVDPSYNTEDGLIRWLQDHGYKNIALQSALEAVPRKTRESMTEWRQMGTSLERAIEIREAFNTIDDSYNTPDGLARWVEDHGFSDIHPQLFRTVVPKSIKERMSEWGLGRGPGSYKDIPRFAEQFELNVAKPHRLKHPEKYEGYEGGILFLRYYSMFRESNSTFYWKGIRSKLPENLQENLRFPNMKYEDLLEVQNKLHAIDDSYNTPDGQIRWLEDNGLQRIGPGRLRDVIPEQVKKQMSKWMPIPYRLYSFDSAREYISLVANVREVFDKNQMDDTSTERRIAGFMARTGLSGEEGGTLLQAAFKDADALITDLSIAKVIQPNQKEFNISNMHQLYGFAEDKFGLTPASVWMIMRLKRINIVGVKGLVDRGERATPKDLSLQEHPQGDEERPTLEDKLGADDPGFEQAEARLVLRSIIRENHLSPEQTLLLERVIDGDDLEDEEYEDLAQVIRRHPELMEMLDQERIFENSKGDREKNSMGMRSTAGVRPANPEERGKLRESGILGSPNWREGIARSVHAGEKIENSAQYRTFQLYQEGDYVPYQDALSFVRDAYPLDPHNPSKPFAKELSIEIADKLGLENNEDLQRIKFYSALNSPLDKFHGVDAMVVYADPAVGEIIVTLDETNNPRKLEGYKADVIIYTTVVDPEEDEKTFLQLIDFWSQKIVGKVNEKIEERLSEQSK